MHGPRHPARRRGPRPVRLVRARGGWPQLHREELGAYEVGLEAARLLRRHFPAFFVDSAAPLPLTPPALLGALLALLQCVEGAHGLALRWPEADWDELPRGATPAETLALFDDVTPELLMDLSYYLAQVRPAYHGDEVALITDEGHETECPLRLTLYHLFQHTGYGLGVEVETLVEGHRLEAVILGCRPLPSDAPVAELCERAAAHIPEAAGLGEPAALIRYAFARTGNPLADTGDYEVQAVYMGEEPDYWPWETADFPALAAQQAAARALEEAFRHWAMRLDRTGAAGVELLAELLHREAAALRRRDRRAARGAAALTGRPLAELLAPTLEVPA